MSYSTPEMVRKALTPTSDGTQPDPPSETGADLTDDQLQDAIDEADAVIDAYLGRYYQVPVANDSTTNQTPHPVDFWSRNLAAYNATLVFRQSLDLDSNDPVVLRYQATMAALQAVANGTVGLQLPDNRSTNSATGAESPYNPYAGDLFTPDDFNVRPLNPAWPVWPDFGAWGDRRW